MSSDSSYSGSRLEVLVLDDDLDMVDLVSAIVGNADARVLGYTSSVEALRAAASRRFDLIITDIRMPNVDGVAFCEVVRRTTMNSRTPVAVVSAYVSEAQRPILDSLGDITCLDKPFEASELTAICRPIRERKKRFNVPSSAGQDVTMAGWLGAIKAAFENRFTFGRASQISPQAAALQRMQHELPTGACLLFNCSGVAEIHCTLTPPLVKKVLGDKVPSLDDAFEITRDLTAEVAASCRHYLRQFPESAGCEVGPVWTYYFDPYHLTSLTRAPFSSIAVDGGMGAMMIADVAFRKQVTGQAA